MWSSRHAVFSGLVAVGLVAGSFSVLAADRAWEFQGDFVSLKPGNPAVAIFLLPDKTRIEVPLAALSEAGRNAIRAAAQTPPPVPSDEVVTVRGPLGKSVTLAAPAVIKAVETDAIWCRDAADAVLVYELYLAGDNLSAAERSAAEARLTEWRKRAAEHRVRQGTEWVTADSQAEVRRVGEEMLAHALQLLKLGNVKLAEAELEKASRHDPEDGRAEFILGLAYALGGNAPKGIEHFLDAARRDPEDPWVLGNLAACEFVAGRYGGLAARFREVLDVVPDAQPVADNLGIVIANGGSLKPKMPERVLADLNDLYKQVVQSLKLPAVEGLGGRTVSLVTPYGKACLPGPATSLPAVLEPPVEWVAGGRAASGVVIAPGRILTTRQVLTDTGEVFVEDPSTPGRRLLATELASLEDPPVTLLQCDTLIPAPLPVAAATPAAGGEIVAVIRTGGPLAGGKPQVARGTIVSTPPQGLGGRFVHSAVVSRGAGGGPIVDATGRLVGIIAPTPRAEASGNTRGLGIPVERIWPLLKEQIADLQAAKPAEPAPAPEAIESQVAPATVRVVSVEKRFKPKAD
jgi:tetratricopeptide (TPR) repeat protein